MIRNSKNLSLFVQSRVTAIKTTQIRLLNCSNARLARNKINISLNDTTGESDAEARSRNTPHDRKWIKRKRGMNFDIGPPMMKTPLEGTYTFKEQFPAADFPKEDITEDARQLASFNAIPEPVLYDLPVLELEDVVKILTDSGAKDIAVIRIDPKKGYVDYMVTCIGLTKRHLTTLGLRLVRTYKARWDGGITKGGSDPAPVSEGLRSKSDWVCINLRNVVVHCMTSYSRENMSLEELHTLGEFDPYTVTPDDELDMQRKADTKYFEKTVKAERGDVDDLAEQYMTDIPRKTMERSAATAPGRDELPGGNDPRDALPYDDMSEIDRKQHFYEAVKAGQTGTKWDSNSLTASLTAGDESEMREFESFLKDQEIDAERFLDGDSSQQKGGKFTLF